MSILRDLARRTINRILPRQTAPIYVGDNTILARTVFGDWIYLDSRDTSLSPAIMLTGNWEPWITKVFYETVKPGMSVVDVGCNCGFYAILAARAVGETGRVVAVDANPRMVDLTRRSISANGMMYRARAVHGAVIDSPRMVEIGVPDEHMGSGSLLIREGIAGDHVTLIQAPGDRLETFLGDNKRVDVLKIDAEGAEPLILRGAEEVLTANRNIQVFMEFAPPMLSGFEPPAEFLARVRSYGFDLYELDTAGGVSLRRDDELLGKDWTELLLKRG